MKNEVKEEMNILHTVKLDWSHLACCVSVVFSKYPFGKEEVVFGTSLYPGFCGVCCLFNDAVIAGQVGW
jgi:hypothetical protein